MSSSSNLASVFTDAVSEHVRIIRELEAQQDSFERAAILMTDALVGGRKVIWCGNGGSAADSQHLAAELVGRFRHPRSPLPSIALTNNTSIPNGVANDYSFDKVFERQVDAVCQPGDVIVGLSTNGESRNVCTALRRGRAVRAVTIALTGQSGGKVAAFADICICVPSTNVARIQEAHILCGHMLCEWIEVATCFDDEMTAAGAVNGRQ